MWNIKYLKQKLKYSHQISSHQQICIVQALLSLNGSYILSRLNYQRTYPSLVSIFQWTWYEAGFSRSAYSQHCGLIKPKKICLIQYFKVKTPGKTRGKRYFIEKLDKKSRQENTIYSRYLLDKLCLIKLLGERSKSNSAESLTNFMIAPEKHHKFNLFLFFYYNLCSF